MTQPYMVKPCPNMYSYIYLACNLNLERSIHSAVVDYLKISLSAIILTSELNSNQLISSPTTKQISYAYAKKANVYHFAIIRIKNT
jgi:hypothetical protein